MKNWAMSNEKLKHPAEDDSANIQHLTGLGSGTLTTMDKKDFGQTYSGMYFFNGSFQNLDTISHTIIIHSNIFAGGQTSLTILAGGIVTFKYVPISSLQLSEAISDSGLYYAFAQLNYNNSEKLPDAEIKIVR